MPWSATTGTAVDVGLSLAALPAVLACGYLGLLALAARRASPVSTAWADHFPFFDVVIPAHNEDAGIARTIGSIDAVDYPRDRFRVVVLADNCTDTTAETARAAGATVVERHDPERRGKGYALTTAFAWSLQDGRADAVVVVDADTSVSAVLLKAFAQAHGAGHDAMQAHYGVRDPDVSWRTRLTSLGFTLFHGVRSSARERLALSCGLRGNGMCFRRDVLRRVPHAAYSIVEDLEYGIALGLAGIRVHYVERAEVFGDMPSTERTSRSQRARWEGGRVEVRRQYASMLIATALERRSAMLLDLAIDLMVPPLSALVLAVVAGGALSAAVRLFSGSATVAVWLWGIAALGLALYVVRGCLMTGRPLRALLDLMWAPLFVAWKLTLRAMPKAARGEWVRTARPASPNEDV